MSAQSNRLIAETLADNATITAAVNRAAREAILSHVRAGHPVAIWRDEQVVWLEPAEVLASFASEPTTVRPE
jgi:hypothetical protein